MIRYHFTPVDTWPVIAQQGVKPYPLKESHLRDFAAVGVTAKNGIYVWPEVDDDLLRDFLLYKRINDGTGVGLLLQCEIPSCAIPSLTLEGDTIRFHHILGMTTDYGGERCQHRARMDICTQWIPPRKVTPIKRIEFAISTVELTAGMNMVVV